MNSSFGPTQRESRYPGAVERPSLVPTLDTARLIDLEGELSREFVADIVGGFLQDVEERLAMLSRAVSERESELATSITHRVQGAAASLGVLRLRVLVTTLERQVESGEWEQSVAMLARILQEFDDVQNALERFVASTSTP